MTIKSSGTLYFSEIATEFGGAAPHALSEYFGGGSLVPSGIGIPASGTISFSQFYGKSKYIAGAVEYTSGTNYFNPTANTIYAIVIAGGGGGLNTNNDYSGAGGGGSGGWYYAHAISGLSYGETCTSVVGNGGVIEGVGGTSALYTSTHGLVLAPTPGSPHPSYRPAGGPGGSPNGSSGGAGRTEETIDGKTTIRRGFGGNGGACTCPTYGGAGGAGGYNTGGTYGDVGDPGQLYGGGGGGGARGPDNGGHVSGGTGAKGFIRVWW